VSHAQLKMSVSSADMIMRPFVLMQSVSGVFSRLAHRIQVAISPDR